MARRWWWPWRRRPRTAGVTEAERQRDAAVSRLEVARAEGAEVTSVTGMLRAIREANHFEAVIREALGRRR